ncbi:MAG: hypothetical protein BMS9Abin19_0490 [Gammaproteobacteria bacterium]|nr:MAG: hypothetical protein BMS9Abin19_0490 [Gammaproteobacteria bacterium]
MKQNIVNRSMKNAENKRDKKSDDFMIGLVTFVAFILFMTAWMYFLT